MTNTSRTSDHHDHEHGHNPGHEHEHHHDHNPHDWDSPSYVVDWAKGQDKKEAKRQEAFGAMANTIPYD